MTIQLHAPGPDPVKLAPVRPSAGVRAWYERQLTQLVDEMFRDVASKLVPLYSRADREGPITWATFPHGEMNHKLDNLEEKWVTVCNERAARIAFEAVYMALRHHDLAFADALKKVGIQVPPPTVLGDRTAVTMDGDVPGHEFHGNQWTGGISFSVSYNPNKRNEASYVSAGKIEVGPKFITMNEGQQIAVLSHEIGHELSDRMLSDGTAFDLQDAGAFGKQDEHGMVWGINGQRTPGENVAEAYSVLLDEPKWLEERYPMAYAAIKERAAKEGFPEHTGTAKALLATLKTSPSAHDAAPKRAAVTMDSIADTEHIWRKFAVKFDLTDRLKQTIKNQLKDNVDLISNRRIKDGPSIPKKAFGEIRKMAKESIEKGRDVVGFTKNLEDRFGITRRRAALIARDQNNKMTALFHRTRQLDCGITEAEWQHTGASLHPREEHEDFDGESYPVEEGHDFDDGPAPVLPGEAINCGCLSSSIIPGYRSVE